MPRIEPRQEDELPEFGPMFRDLEAFFGFLPNDYLTMGRKPDILAAVGQLTRAVVFAPGRLPMGLRLLVAYSASRAAGCMYCVAHCATLAERHGVGMEKIANIHAYATHPAFGDAERAALRLADLANQVPNAVTDADFDALRRHVDDEAIVEIVAIVAMMAFYNRWNDTLATSLERPAQRFAEGALAAAGWSGAKHA